MASEDMLLTSMIRRVLVQHRVDVSKINMTVTHGSVRLYGIVSRDDGEDVQPSVMSIVDQKLEVIPGIRRVAYEFENLIFTGEAWVQIGRSRAAKETERVEDMLIALRIRQIFISFRIDASQINISVTNGIARMFGRVAMESGADVTPSMLSSLDSRIEKVKGLNRRNYEFENVFHAGDTWIPINRRRNKERREAGDKVEG